MSKQKHGSKLITDKSFENVLDEARKMAIEYALTKTQTNGNRGNLSQASRALRLSRPTVMKYAIQYGLWDIRTKPNHRKNK